MPETAAIIGGGVIGGGWAARFLLNGWDVQVFDPDPEAERKIGEVLENARRALPMLYDCAMPREGRLTLSRQPVGRRDGAAWIQESVPERLALKHKIYQTFSRLAAPGAVIGSSTSGVQALRASARRATRPEQIIVTHPFNPVYLMP